MSLEEVLSLEIALLNLALKGYPTRHEAVDAILWHAHALVNARLDAAAPQPSTNPGIRALLKLLNVPVLAIRNVLVLLKLPAYSAIMSLLHLPLRRRVALDLVRSLIDNATVIP